MKAGVKKEKKREVDVIAMQNVRLELLGGFRLTNGQGQPVEVPAKKNRAMLGILAMSPHMDVTRDKLAGLLWSDRADEQARNSVRQSLVALRKDFAGIDDGILVLTGDRIALDKKYISIDCREFLISSASSEIENQRRAASFYAGPFLDGLNIGDAAFEEWLREARQDLQARAIKVFSSLAERLPPNERVAMAERLVAIDPLREASHLVLMQAHQAMGDSALAVQQYESVKLLLKRELQVAPGEELRAFRKSLDGNSVAGRAPPGGADLPADASTRAAQSEKPSIAVLPFSNMSGDPEQDYFADGVCEEITTELSRFRNLHVIARQSSRAFKGISDDLRNVCRKLGVRYLVDGSARMVGRDVRIHAQLIDGETGGYIWADKFHRDASEIYVVQDELVRTIASTVGERVEAVAKERVRRLDDNELRAHDFYIRAAAAEDGNTRADYERAASYLQRAIEVDPMMAQAHHHLSLVRYIQYMAFWVADRDVTFSEAEAASKRALSIDARNSGIHAHHGILLSYRGEYDQAEHHLMRALDLNPNDSKAHALYGFFLTATGQLEEAFQAFERAMRLNPFQPSWTNWLMGIGHFTARRYRDAIMTLSAIALPMNEVRGWLAAAYAQAGDQDRAAAQLRSFLDQARIEMASPLPEALSAWQPFWRSAIPYRDPANFEHIMEGLRKAGMAD